MSVRAPAPAGVEHDAESLAESLASLGSAVRRGAGALQGGAEGGRVLTRELLHSFAPDGQAAEGGLAHLASLDMIRADLECIPSKGVLNLCASLRSVDLSYNRVTAFDPDIRLPELKEAVLDFNRCTRMNSFAPLTALTRLSLRDNAVTDLAGINSLGNLKVALLDGNRLTSLKGVELPLLEVLDVSRNRLQVIESCKLPRLTELTLSYNELESFAGMDCFTSLKELDASNNMIDTPSTSGMAGTYAGRRASSALTPLRLLQHLTLLNVRENRLTSVSFLPSLPKLKELLLSNNQLGCDTPDDMPQTPSSVGTPSQQGAGRRGRGVGTPSSRADDDLSTAVGEYATDEEDTSRLGSATPASAASRGGRGKAGRGGGRAGKGGKQQRRTETASTAGSGKGSRRGSQQGVQQQQQRKAVQRRPLLRAIADLCPALEVLDVSGNPGAIVSYSHVTHLQRCKSLAELSVQGSVAEVVAAAGGCAEEGGGQAAASEREQGLVAVKRHLNLVYSHLSKLEVVENYTVTKSNTLDLMEVEDCEGGPSPSPVPDPAGAAADMRERLMSRSSNSTVGTGSSVSQQLDVNTLPCDESGVSFVRIQRATFNGLPAWGSSANLGATANGRPGTASSVASSRPGTSSGRPAAKTLSRGASMRSGRSFATPDEARVGLENLLSRLHETRDAAAQRVSKLQAALELLPGNVLEIKEAALKVEEVLNDEAPSTVAGTADELSPRSSSNAAFLKHVREATSRRTTPAAASPTPHPPSGLTTKPLAANLVPAGVIAQPRSKYHHLQKREIQKAVKLKKGGTEKRLTRAEGVVVRKEMSFTEEVQIIKAKQTLEREIEDRLTAHHERCMWQRAAEGADTSARADDCDSDSTASCPSPAKSRGTTAHADTSTANCINVTTGTSTDSPRFLSSRRPTEEAPAGRCTASTSTATETAPHPLPIPGNPRRETQPPPSKEAAMQRSDQEVIRRTIASIQASSLGTKAEVIVEPAHEPQVFHINADDGVAYSPRMVAAVDELDSPKSPEATNVVVAGGDRRSVPAPRCTVPYDDLLQRVSDTAARFGPSSEVQRKLSHPNPLHGKRERGGGMVKGMKACGTPTTTRSSEASSHPENDAMSSSPATPHGSTRPRKQGSLNCKTTRRR